MNAALRVLWDHNVYGVDIAQYLGVSPATVSRHLVGRSADPTPVLMAILDLAGPTVAAAVQREIASARKLRLESDSHRSGAVAMTIKIDRDYYTVDRWTMTGAELRLVPPTPIPADRDLFEVVRGHTDHLVRNDHPIEIVDGQRFFTVPRSADDKTEEA